MREHSSASSSTSLSSVSVSSHHQRQPAIWPSLLWFTAAYAADSASSLALLAGRGWEVNPLLRAAYTLHGAAGFLALKALFALLVVVAALLARYSATTQSARLARFLLGLGSVTWLLFAFVNLAALSAA